MNTMFNTLLAAAAQVEAPVDGQTGVWLKSGAAVISSAMKMAGAVVSSGQSQYVYNRGVAQNTLIAAGGLQYVSAGGSALGVVVSNAPTSNTITNGGYISGLELYNASATSIQPTGYIDGAVLRTSGTGYLTRLSCWYGSAGSVTMSKGAVFNVHHGARIAEVTVSSGAYMSIDGEAVVGRCITTPGAIISAYLCVVEELVTSGGGFTLASGCELGTITVVSRGTVTVTAGGELSDRQVDTLTVVYNVGAIGSNVQIGQSAAAQIRTVSASAFTVASGGSATLFSGCTLHGATVSAGGTLTVSSGGTALAVTSNAGAVVTVLNGGYIEYA